MQMAARAASALRDVATGETVDDAAAPGCAAPLKDLPLDVRTLGWALRASVGAAVVLPALGAALVVLAPRQGVTTLAGYTAWCLAWGLALAGATCAHWGVRLAALAAFALGAWGAVWAVAALAVWMTGGVMAEWWAARRGHRAPARWLPGATFALALALLLLRYPPLGDGAPAHGSFVSAVTATAALLMPAFFLVAAAAVSAGDAAGRTLAAVAARARHPSIRHPLAVAAAGVALVGLGVGLYWSAGVAGTPGVLVENVLILLASVAVLAGTVALVARWLRVRVRPGAARVPLWALVLAAVAALNWLYAAPYAARLIAGLERRGAAAHLAGRAAGIALDLAMRYNAALPMALGIATGVGLLLLARGLTRPPAWLAPSGLFFVVFGLVLAPEGLHEIAYRPLHRLIPYEIERVGPSGVMGYVQVYPSFDVPHVQLAAAAGTLAALGWLAWRRELARRSALVVALVALNVALLALVWVRGATLPLPGDDGALPTATALLYLLAPLWVLLASGGWTNRSGAGFPRRARVLLTAGAALLLPAVALLATAMPPGVFPPAVLLKQPGFDQIGASLALALCALRLLAGRDVGKPEAGEPSATPRSVVARE